MMAKYCQLIVGIVVLPETFDKTASHNQFVDKASEQVPIQDTNSSVIIYSMHGQNCSSVSIMGRVVFVRLCWQHEKDARLPTFTI